MMTKANIQGFMTTAQASEASGLTAHRIGCLVRAGEIDAVKSGNTLLVDAASLQAYAKANKGRGRPMDARTAYGALWLLSGLDANWLSYAQARRLRIRLRSCSAEELSWQLRKRAQTRRYRASGSFLAGISDSLVLSGASSALLGGFGLLKTDGTTDVDMLVDVLSDSRNVGMVVRSLESLGFEPQEPGLRGSAFHRMAKGSLVVDVLVADHLPSGKQRAAKVNAWPMMEAPGGAQAIERKAEVEIASETRQATVMMPNLLGALVLKCAAYAADRRNPHRHLEDIALLASLMTDHADALSQLHGSDKKRLRKAAGALADPNEPSWLLLPAEQRVKGQDTMRILGS